MRAYKAHVFISPYSDSCRLCDFITYLFDNLINNGNIAENMNMEINKGIARLSSRPFLTFSASAVGKSFLACVFHIGHSSHSENCSGGFGSFSSKAASLLALGKGGHTLRTHARNALGRQNPSARRGKKARPWSRGR